MSLIVSMTIAGTIPMLFHYLMKASLKERYTSRWRKWTLYLSMFFYFCPFQELKYIFPLQQLKFLYWRPAGERFYQKLPGVEVLQ